MRATQNNQFAALRRVYDNLEQLGRIINRGRVTVCGRLQGATPWKTTEKELILDDLIRRGIEKTKDPETFNKYFGG